MNRKRECVKIFRSYKYSGNKMIKFNHLHWQSYNNRTRYNWNKIDTERKKKSAQSPLYVRAKRKENSKKKEQEKNKCLHTSALLQIYCDLAKKEKSWFWGAALWHHVKLQSSNLVSYVKALDSVWPLSSLITQLESRGGSTKRLGHCCSCERPGLNLDPGFDLDQPWLL